MVKFVVTVLPLSCLNLDTVLMSLNMGRFVVVHICLVCHQWHQHGMLNLKIWSNFSFLSSGMT